MGDNKPATPAIKGAIITLVLLAVGAALYFGAGIANRNAVYALCVVVLAGIAISSSYYAKQMAGNVTFGNVFAEGFKTAAVVIVLSSLCVFVSLKFIFPGVIDRLLQAGANEMKKQGSTAEEIKEYMDSAKNYLVPIIVGCIIFFFGIVGAVGALLGAILADKKPAEAAN